MRIAFFAKSHKRSGITTHIERGLESLGHRVLRINRHKSQRLIGKSLARMWIRARVKAFKPDLILIFTRDIEQEMLEEFAPRYPTAQFYDDCNVPLRDEVLEMARVVGHFFITARGQVAEYEARGAKRVSYVTGGCDAMDHFMVAPVPEFRSQLAFIGSAGPDGSRGQKDRVELMSLLAERFELKIYGRGWEQYGLKVFRDEVFPPQYREICASADAMIGLDLRDDVDLYFSNRTWITLGCGGLLLTRYVPNLEEILKEGQHLFWWKNFQDCAEVAGKVVAMSPEQRAEIKTAGSAYAHDQYSYARMCERMLRAIKERGA